MRTVTSLESSVADQQCHMDLLEAERTRWALYCSDRGGPIEARVNISRIDHELAALEAMHLPAVR